MNRSVNAEYGFYAGGNIVRNSDYIPEEKELCRQLAEECDILVYWYKDIEGQASAAARLGLSTGVPCIFKTGARMLREGIPDGAALYSDNLLLAINHLIVYENEREKLSKNAQEFCANNSYEIAAKKYLELT